MSNQNREIPVNNDRTPDNDNTQDPRVLAALQRDSIPRVGDRRQVNDHSQLSEIEIRRQMEENLAAAQKQQLAIAQALGTLLKTAPLSDLNSVIKDGEGFHLPEITAMLKDVAQLHPENQTVLKTEATLTNSKDPRVAQIVMNHFKNVTDSLIV